MAAQAFVLIWFIFRLLHQCHCCVLGTEGFALINVLSSECALNEKFIAIIYLRNSNFKDL